MARKRPMKRKLRSLAEREAEQRRDLGATVLGMYRSDELDPAAIEAGVGKLAETQEEIASIEAALEGTPPEPAEEQSEATSPETDGAVERTEPQTEVQPALGAAAASAAVKGKATEAEAEKSKPEEPKTDDSEAPAPEAEAPKTDEFTAPAAVEPARAQPTPPSAAEANERSAAAMLALEQDLERAQQRAGQALEALRDQLEQAKARADAAEERSKLHESETRTAAAEWLRGQAEAMRREAERQVREDIASEAEGSETAKPAPGRSPSSEAAETALAEMTKRSNEANARAQEAEARLAEATTEAEERGRLEAEERLATELRAREEEVQQEREAKARALEGAEKRLAEIEAQVAEAERRASGGESSSAAAVAGGGKTNLNLATFDQLRGLGLSPTQANRVIAYRERLGGYKAVADLGQVPGMPEALVSELGERLDL